MGFATHIETDSHTLSKYTAKQLHELYDHCVLELAFCARHVPGMNDLMDSKYQKREIRLLQLQDDIIDYVSHTPIQTLEAAEALAKFWNDIVASGSGECLQMANQLAENIISFYQSRVIR